MGSSCGSTIKTYLTPLSLSFPIYKRVYKAITCGKILEEEFNSIIYINVLQYSKY